MPLTLESKSLFLIISISLILSLMVALVPTKSSPPFVPLTVGTTWIYKSKDQLCQNLSYSIENLTVIDSFTRGNLACGLIEHRRVLEYNKTVENAGLDQTRLNVPAGRSPMAGQASYSIYLIFDNCRFYELQFESLNSWEAMKKQHSKIEEPHESNLIMKTPVDLGAEWDRNGMQKGWYCWTLGAKRAQHFCDSQIPEYVTTFRSCPDHTVRAFVPGLGISRLEYHHHGTVIESAKTLIDFNIAAGDHGEIF